MSDACLCTSADAAVCGGGGRPPNANGCDCACHGGADATDALPQPAAPERAVPATRHNPLVGRSAIELAHGLVLFVGGNPDAGSARMEHADTLLSLAATEDLLAEALRVGLEECERLRAVVRSLDHTVWDTEDECDALRTERDCARADGRAAGLREALAIVASYQRPSASPEPTELDHIVSVIGAALSEAEGGGA